MLASSNTGLLPLVVILFTSVAWLAGGTLGQISCNPGEVVNRGECERAISQIVYEKPGNTLDRVSSRFAKLSGNCTIFVSNSNLKKVTKQQIEGTFKKIFDQCQPLAGQNFSADGPFLQTQDHRLEHDTDYFPPQNLTCGLNTNAPLTADQDCQDAYNSILVDGKGRLVLVYTTDGSSIIVKKSELESVVSKAIKQCKGKASQHSLSLYNYFKIQED
ncbi:hypothetical protein VP01_451g3 [Puccinia sorghi]|uniref:Uncharacterized protein n=1 Tax=Puccinia sorghi TaxID=27349 RepID=A0A0L6UP09_9BASI|nr:hypothetical protein VP01_451g3 [Puccinia sorghi]